MASCSEKAASLSTETERVLQALNLSPCARVALAALDPEHLATYVARLAKHVPDVEIALAAEVALSNDERLAAYPWEQCVSDRIADGYSEDSANRICAYIKRKSQGASVVSGGGPPLGIESLRSVSVEIPLDESGKPRDEVRLLKHGVNPTENGDYLFGTKEAKEVMAHYARHGVDVMIDLEHLSLDPKAPHYDPDARGRARLELRGGELWLAGIKWTADGSERITSRKQTYVSPAFPTNPEGRITKIINVALTALPATDDAMPLIASVRRTQEGKSMEPKVIKEALEMLRAGKSEDETVTKLAIDVKTVQAVVKAMGGDPAGDLVSLFKTIQDFAKELADAASGKAPMPEAPPEPQAEEAEAPQAMRAATDEIKTLRAETKKLTDELAVLRSEREEREAIERKALGARLVKAGQPPAMVWSDDGATKLRSHLATAGLVELRELVRIAEASPAQSNNTPPPAGTPALTAQEIQICKESGADPAAYQALRSRFGARA